MKWIGDYLALALRWTLMVLCTLCGLALGLTALVLASLDAYDWLKYGSTDITPLSALTGHTEWTGLQKLLDRAPVWLFMFIAAGGLLWVGKALKLKHHAGHYLMGRRHKHEARKLQGDWDARKRKAERLGQSPREVKPVIYVFVGAIALAVLAALLIALQR